MIKTFSHRRVMIWYYNSSYLYLWTKIIVRKKNCHVKMKALFFSSACTEGYYGSRCAMNCSSMCQSNSAGRTCEMDTGKCISGCSSNSYTGDNCDIMCASNCLGSCSNTDGVCALTSNNTRCKAGYQGFYCNESRYQRTK